MVGQPYRDSDLGVELDYKIEFGKRNFTTNGLNGQNLVKVSEAFHVPLSRLPVAASSALLLVTMYYLSEGVVRYMSHLSPRSKFPVLSERISMMIVEFWTVS